jgi:hypothetical protein
MKPHLEMKIDFEKLELALTLRQNMIELFDLVKPVKFPAPPRRRREDREIPKAA